VHIKTQVVILTSSSVCVWCMCSLCTTLCLQWEPEIIAVAVMYLTSRLTKFNITDWHGKPAGYRGKWYEFIVEDVTLELLEGLFTRCVIIVCINSTVAWHAVICLWQMTRIWLSRTLAKRAAVNWRRLEELAEWTSIEKSGSVEQQLN